MEKEQCSNCKFWEEEDAFVGEDRTYGQCKRYPPLIQELEQSDWPKWPKTYSVNWCGEWEAKG